MKRQYLTLEQLLLVGSFKEREEEARRQGVIECWETKARRDEQRRRCKREQ